MDISKHNERKPRNFMGRQSLESQVEQLYLSGMSEPEIAKKLKVSSKYVHGALIILKLVD